MPALTVHNAEIKTAAVEVKTLTISGKQVTLAVFRQLKEEALINEDGALNGMPWGTINYHPDKCGDPNSHWHVVWQRGTELLRSRIGKVPSFDPGSTRWSPAVRGWTLVAEECPFVSEATDRLLCQRVHDWVHGRTQQEPLNRRPAGHSTGFTNFLFDFNKHVDLPVLLYASDVAVRAANLRLEANLKREEVEKCEPKHDEYGRWSYFRSAHEKAEAEFLAAMAVLDADVENWGLSRQEVKIAARSAAKAEADRRNRHRAVHASLADLPQLFIAV